MTSSVQPNAMYRADAGAGGQSWIGYVARGGSIRVLEYDHSTDTVAVRTIHSGFAADDHNVPALLVRDSDDKVLTVYSAHNSTPINRRISTNALDVSAWGSATNLDGQLGGSRYTYPNLAQLTGVTGDPIYLHYRDEPSAGTDSRWNRSVSMDDGVTWSAQSIIFRQASRRSYWTTISDGVDRIHYFVYNGETGASGAIGHFYYDGAANTYHASDGTNIGSPPFDKTEITTIVSGFVILPMTPYLDGANPVCVAVATIGGTYRYYFLRWTGSAWIAVEVANGGTGYPYSSPTLRATFAACLDDGDLDTFYSLEPTGAGTNSELYRYRTSDNGATWGGRLAMTSGTGILQTRVAPVRNRNPELAVFWTYGTTTGFPVYEGNWNMGLKGLRAT